MHEDLVHAKAVDRWSWIRWSRVHGGPLRRCVFSSIGNPSGRGLALSTSVDNATARVAPKSPQAGSGRVWPGLRGFLAWWLNALGTWLPPRLRAVFGLAQQRLLLRCEGDALTLALTLPVQPGEAAIRDLAELPWGPAEAAAEEPLTRILSPRINGLPRWLLLPGRSGLRRRLTLPAAAAERLREVLGFEIDRQTPFTLDEVYYDARLVGRRGDGQIDAELVVVPRASLAQALAALGEPVGATLSGVDMAGPDGLPLGVNLLPGAQRRRRRDPRAVWNLALAAIALLATAAGLWQIRENREAAADAFEAEAKRHGAQARKVSAEKKQLIDLVEGMRFLQQTRNGRPSTVEVLDEITRRLPDNTYLEKISIEGERIMIIGLSPEAPRLLERLQSSKLWRAMNFTGALMPEPTKGKDRFNLSADLAVTAPAADKKPRGGAAADTERAP